MIRDTKSADGSQAFAERADDKIDAVFDIALLRKSAAPLPQHTKRMGFVYKQTSAMLLFYRRDFRQRRSISQRAIDAFYDDQRVGTTLPKTSQALVEITDIVVAEPNDFCPAHPAAVINACMAIGIDKDHISRPGERRKKAQISNVPG